MKKVIKKMIDQLYPELSNQYHLPRFAQVMGVRETPQNGNIADPYRPYYAVDVQVLDQNGKPDPNFPVIHDVPLPTSGAGHEQGMFAMPQDGTRVELAFAYGSPNQPFIRSVLPHNLSLPNVNRNEQRWQQSSSSYQTVDQNGSWITQTDADIKEDSLRRVISALENLETYTKSLINVEADATETIGGTKRLDAMGAVRINSGGRLDLMALSNLIAKSSTKLLMTAPKTWIGSDNENVLRILSELMQLVINLCNTLATHTHPSVGACDQAATINSVSTSTSGIKTRLDNIKE